MRVLERLPVRYVDHRLPSEDNVYVISILESHSRAILASAITRSQDTSAFLSVLYEAVERYGSPEILVTDSGSVFRANRAQAIYEALNIRKEEIERGKPWQNYVETTFNIQRRMADYHFSVAESWPELLKVHEEWVSDYNEQSHWAHRKRKDGRRSPQEVLGWVTGVRYRPEDLERAFFSIRFSRMLDPLGYATFWRWRLSLWGGGDRGERGRPPCGCRRRVSRWSMPGSPSPATRWNTSRPPASCDGSVGRPCSRLPFCWDSRGCSIWPKPLVKKGG